MSEWTPGPWRKENPDWMTPHIWIAADNDNGGIAKIECCDHDDGLGERLTGTDYANAHLIAAAPDLYEALAECRKLLDGEGGMPVGVRSRADAALSKAIGNG